MVWWQYVLFPFSVLYDGVTRLRNALFDRKILPVFHFDTNVIAVGNLAVGGTGKTPMTTYLIDHYLEAGNAVSTLSRGYGRRTHGFRMATAADSATSIGDEAYMLFLRYHDRIGIAVGAEREFAIPELLYHCPETEIIVLDDAFQYREVQPSLHIVLTTFQNPFYQDYLMPAGRLRESRSEARRADIIIVTKCPDQLSEAQMVHIRDQIGRFSKSPVFFTSVVYGQPQPFGDTRLPLHKNVVGISGIAHSAPFQQYLKTHFEPRLLHSYEDHHRYSPQDINDIVNELNDHTSLLTTEKDMAKLINVSRLQNYSCFYLPISIRFLKDEALFFSLMNERLKNYDKTTD